MFKLILFLHLLGSIGMGFYLLMPIMVRRLAGNPDAAQAGFAGFLVSANRIGQYLLILQFLTGGYMIGQGSYSVLWSVLVVVLFLAIAAFTGMMGKPLKRIRDHGGSNKKDAGTDAAKVRLFGALNFIALVLTIFLMKYPELFV